MDDKLTNELRALIAEIARKEIKNDTSNMEYVYDGIVCESNDSNDSTLDLDVRGVRYKLSDFPNYTGATLAKDDVVRIYARGDRLSDAYIGVKFSKNSWG